MPKEKLTEVRIFAQAVREAQREREREILRERRSDAGHGSREAGKRGKRGLSGNDARARSVHNWRSSSLGPV